MVSVRLMGAGLFTILALVGLVAATAIIRAVTAPKPAARFVPPGAAGPSPSRPCAVYEIDTQRGGLARRYIGYGFNPHQRIMQTHRRAKWWPYTVTAARTLEPDRVDWYPNEDIAHAEEVRRIRAANPKTLENKVLYRQGAAQR